MTNSATLGNFAAWLISLNPYPITLDALENRARQDADATDDHDLRAMLDYFVMTLAVNRTVIERTYLRRDYMRE